jgi:hypothetical protein
MIQKKFVILKSDHDPKGSSMLSRYAAFLRVDVSPAAQGAMS